MSQRKKRPFTTLRRLLSRAGEDWRQVVEDLFGAAPSSTGPRPLRVMRLERRRVLSADFSIVGGSLLLDGFDGPEGDTLSIVQEADNYLFTTEGGWSSDAATPNGVSLQGETLSVDRGLLESLPNGLVVADGDDTPLNVKLGGADFSGLSGPVSLLSASSIEQQPQTSLGAPTAGVQLASAPSGLTLTSLSVAGNLELFAFGQITDGPGTQLIVTGDAAFTSQPVDGITPGGITLADDPSDLLRVGGSVTFNAGETGDRWDIQVGVDHLGEIAGWTEFGDLTVRGDNVVISERASTRIERIDANQFTLTSAGVVDTTVDATIDVTGDASITSTGSRFRGDFTDDQTVNASDRAAWAAGYGTVDAARSDGDANGDGLVNAADYTLWRDDFGKVDAGGGILVSVAERFAVGGQAELIAVDGADRYEVLVSEGVDATFGSLAVTGSTVSIWEDANGIADGTVLDFVESTSLFLSSDGPVTDSAGAVVTAEATLTVVADGAIVLADEADNTLAAGDLARLTSIAGESIDIGVDPSTGVPVDAVTSSATFGQMTLNTAGAARIALDGDAVFTGRSELGALTVQAIGSLLDEPTGRVPTAEILVAGNASLFATDEITLADTGVSSNAVEAGGNLTLEVATNGTINLGIDPTINSPAGGELFASDGVATAGRLTFRAPEGAVRINLDSDIRLTEASEAASLSLGSTAAPGSSGFISNNRDASLLIDGAAWVRATDDAGDPAPVSLGTAGGDEVRFGSLAVFGSQVEVSEDAPSGDSAPGTLLTAVTADSLTLMSAGPITDSDSAVIQVTNDASLTAAGDIRLSDANQASNVLQVGGLGSFTAGTGQDIDLGVVPSTGLPAASQVRLGSLAFVAPEGDVRIALDGEARLEGSSRSDTLELTSVGPISDAANTSLRIEAATRLTANDPGGAGPQAITLGDNPGDTTTFGTLEVFGSVVTIQEDATVGDATPGTALADVTAEDLTLTSAGPITNLPAATITVTDLAVFDAGANDITLAEGTIAFGRLSLTGADVTVSESDGTLLNFTLAENLTLTSIGELTDEADAIITVAADATLTATMGITLADDNRMTPGGDPATPNTLVTGGHTSLIVSVDQNIDVGVDPATGLPAAAIFRSGSLSFSAPGGQVRIAEDADTLLAGASTTAELTLRADEGITDAADAGTTTEATRFAKLITTNEHDIVLGDGGAEFKLGDPTAFDVNQYLQVTAEDVSIQADSSVNVLVAPRLTTATPAVAGTYFLTSTGNVTQVGADTTFEATKVAVQADGAVFFDRLALLSTDVAAPNLQIQAGDPIALSSAPAERYQLDRIPDQRTDAFAPIVTDADNAQGVRTNPIARVNPLTGEPDAGLEDLLVEGTNARLLESDSTASPGEQPTIRNGIDGQYAAVVQVTGSAIVGAVNDATTAQQVIPVATPRGLVVESTGNAFVTTDGELTFSGEGNFDTEQEATVVELAGGVLTAIAGTSLAIVTDEPNQPAVVQRTTKLSSKTGTVTAFAEPGQSGEDTGRGPRVLLDAPTEEATAATTGLVRADNDFEQRITVALGSRGEDNLLVEVEWADVADVRESSSLRPDGQIGSNPPFRGDGVELDFDPNTPGSTPYADLIQTPQEEIEPTQREDGLVYGNEISEDFFRTVTIRHNYAEQFIPSNPQTNLLPTTVFVFNDPAINLFESNGEVDLNSASFDLVPRIIAQPGGFYLISATEMPAQYVTAETVIGRETPSTEGQRTQGEVGRVASVSTAEDVIFGRVSDDAEGEWAEGIPGESWPMVEEDAEGDFLREIREKIDNGPFSEGRYQIRVRTPRGEQLLEEWTKGDLNAEDTQPEIDPASEEAIPAAAAEPPNAADAFPNAEGTLPNAEVKAELPPLLAPVPSDDRLSNATAPEATQAAFAAMAAVGAWGRRLGGRDGFALDSDGVSFTRINRRRRKPRS